MWRKTLRNVIVNKLPILKWAPKYQTQYLRGDIIAGITVGLMVIPQSLAYAQIAHLPKQYGLYSAYLCCFIYAICGTAKDVSVGPTSILSLITYSAVAGDITKSIALATCCGILQTTLAILHAGVLFDFISDPVIAGFTSSTALIIASTQVKDLFGFKPRTSHIYYTVYDTFAHIPDMSCGDTVMGVGCIVFLLLITFIHRRIRPGMSWSPSWMTSSRYANLCILYSARYAILVTITTCMSYGLGSHITWKRVDYMPRGLPSPATPHIVWETISEYYADIISLAIIGFLESIAIAKAFARENGYQHTLDGNQELFAVGIANVFSSFFHSYAVTGSFSRTSVNAASGAHTPVSSAVTGIVVILAIFLLTPTFAWIPVACLAAIVISAALPLCDFNYPLQLYRTMQYYDLATYVVAFIGCLLLDIQWGMLAACGLSLVIVLYQQARPKYEIYSVEGERDSVHLIPFHPTSHPHVPILNASPSPSPSSSSSSSTSSVPLLTSHTPHILLFRMHSSLAFLNITYIQQQIISLYHIMSKWDGDSSMIGHDDIPQHEVSLYPTTLNVQPIHQHDVHDVSSSDQQSHDSLHHRSQHPHPHQHPHPTLVIDFLHITSLDTSGLRLLMDLVADGCEHGVMTHFVNVKDGVEMKMRHGFPSTLFPSGLSCHIHSSVDAAYASITSQSLHA